MNSKDAQNIYRKATDLYREQRYEEAIVHFDRLFEVYPDRKEIVYARARCLAALGRVDDAMDLCLHLSTHLGDARGEALASRLARRQRKSVSVEPPDARSDVKSAPRRRRLSPNARVLIAAVLLMVTVFGAYFYWIVYPKVFRIMRFSGVESLGMLYIRDPLAGESTWTTWREARGTLAVRRDKQVRLVFDESYGTSSGESTGLSALKGMEPDTFWEVDASNVALGDDGLRQLAVFQDLHRLVLHNTGITGAGFATFSPATRLESLDLSANPFLDEWVPWVAQFESLANLDLRDTAITDFGLIELSPLKAIRTLVLPYEIGDDGLKQLQVLTGLESLDLSRRRVSDRGLKFVAQLSSLKDLDLSATPITNEGIRRLASLTELLSLKLAHTRIGDPALETIATFEDLQQLDLSGTRVTDAGLELLSSLTALMELNLSSCCGESRITADGIPALLSLSLLRKLDLSGSRIRDADIELLAKLNVTQLNVERTALSRNGAERLARLLPQCRVIYEPEAGEAASFPGDVSLGLIWVRDREARWLRFDDARGEVRLPEGRPVRIDLTPAGVLDLAAVVSAVGSERLLALRFPDVSKLSGVDYRPLSQATRLEELDLTAVPFNPAIRDALAGMSSLRILKLSGSGLTDEELVRIAPLAELREIDLSGTRVGNSVWAHLARFPALRSVKLRGTPVSAPTQESLSAFTSLNTLDLIDTAVGENELAGMRDALPETDILHHFIEYRDVVFPKASSLGRLWMRSASETPQDKWIPAGEAQGRVRIPTDFVLRLDIAQGGDVDFTLLAELAPDALHTLHLTGPSVDDAVLRHVVRLKSLQVLDLFGTSITNDGLDHIKRMSNLTALHAIGWETGLPAPSRLSSLVLSGTSVTDDGLVNLAALTSLNRLDLARTGVTDAGLEHLRATRTLGWLSLEGTETTEAGRENLRARLPDLRITYPIQANVLRPEAAESSHAAPPIRVVGIAQGRAVGTLYMRDWESANESDWERLDPLCSAVPVPARKALKLVLTAEDALHLDRLSSLNSEALQAIVFAPGTRITSQGLRAISHFQSLQSLALDFTYVENGAFESLAALVGLRELRLYKAEFEENELVYLRNLPWLRELDISTEAVSDEALVHLASIPGLEELDLHNNDRIADLGVSYVSTLGALRQLDLNRTAVSDASLEMLRSSESLENLDIYRTSVSDRAVAQYRQERETTELHRERLKLNAYEVAELAPVIRDLVQSAEPLTRRALAEILGVDTLSEIISQSLTAVQEVALDALVDQGRTITTEFLSEISGVDKLSDVPEEVRLPLQERALVSLSETENRITYYLLSEVAGVETFNLVGGDERLRLQSLALSALANTDTGITEKDFLEMEGAGSLRAIPDARLSALQSVALQAMADSRAGVTENGLEAVTGVDSIDKLRAQEREFIQDLALDAMANSRAGITAEDLAMLEGVSDYDSLPQDSLDSLQTRAMSAMAVSETGITARGIGELGGEDDYEDLTTESMESLQQLALSTMSRSNIRITSEDIAQIGGHSGFEELPEERLDTLQDFALSAMATSHTGITVDNLVAVGGVENFAGFTPEILGPLQTKALSAMASSSSGITLDGLATVAGVRSYSDLSEEKLGALRSRAVSAMARSGTDIGPSKLLEILGGTALEVLDMSYTDIVDTDLYNIVDWSKLRSVDLSGCTGITDRGVARLADAKGLEKLLLSGTGVTDQALTYLWGLDSLRELNLSNTRISDNGLAPIISLPALETLSLADTPIEGAGLSYLRNLDSLRRLDLSRTQVTDSGLANLPTLSAMETLLLQGTRVTDSSLDLVGRNKSLKDLELSECPAIGDAGLDKLLGLPSLTRLSVYATNISELSLENLESFHSLRYLYVNHAMFSSKSLDVLRVALPRCLVQGVGTLTDRAQIDGGAEATASLFLIPGMAAADLQGAATAFRAFYRLALVLTVVTMLFAPFTPVYMGSLERFQNSGAAGKTAKVLLRWTYVSGVVINLAGRAALYALRWLILVLSAAIAIYVLVRLANNFFDTYLDTRTPRL
ncbi:MAG: tetratricopeptide repeat protein [Candidatus Hydrogenedentes bacterium]|nr:tetratricopeptide repeat protein [Candidatus Hydrogenedentota bacterium]